jgi:hypothetical protein
VPIDQSLSTTPTLSALGDGSAIPSIPNLSGSMPALSLPGSSIEVTSNANYKAGSESKPAAGPETNPESTTETTPENSTESTGSSAQS